MEHLEDITPHAYRHVAIPNATMDHLWSLDVLAPSVLAMFMRHSDGYGANLSKMLGSAGRYGPRDAHIRRAYNLVIAEGYLVRVRFRYERAPGMSGPASGWATHQYVSRVPISSGMFAEHVVQPHTPGKFTLLHVGDGEYRRVRVLDAQVYCADGIVTVDRDGLLTPHPGHKQDHRPSLRATAANAAPAAASPPESEIPTSGATSENDLSSQVAPKSDSPNFGDSACNKKTNEKTKKTEAGASLRSLPTEQTPPQAPGFTPSETDRSPEHGETSKASSAGDPPPTHARPGGDGTENPERRDEPPTCESHKLIGPTLSCPDCERRLRAQGAIPTGPQATERAERAHRGETPQAGSTSDRDDLRGR